MNLLFRSIAYRILLLTFSLLASRYSYEQNLIDINPDFIQRQSGDYASIATRADQVNPQYNIYGGFDSTHTLAICQKYIIDENVVNGDLVGTWLKTWTWMSDGAISFSLVDDLNGRFAIHSATGVITIADASKINGKIIQQDTIFNLLVKTTDAIYGYEIDTARIRVKENSYCRYIDFSKNSNGNGLSRTTPWNVVNKDLYTAGYGYFMKRGSVAYGKVQWIQALIATEKNPTVFAAYGTGRNPVFDGTGAEGYRCLTIGGNGTLQEKTDKRVEYMEMADIEIKDYDGTAINVYNWSQNLGFYNMYLHNNDRLASQSAWAISVTDDAVIGKNMPHEWINCVFDTTGITPQAPFSASHIKLGAGPSYIYNCYFGWTSEQGLRIGGGNVADKIKHCYFDSKHQVGKGNEYAIQMRDANVIFEDIIIRRFKTGIFITSEEIPWHPYNAVFRDCHIYSTEVGIYNYPVTNEHNRGTGYVIENCLIENCVTGISLERDDGTIIRRNIISNTDIGIHGSLQACINTRIHYNVLENNRIDINLEGGKYFDIFRNTATGIISTTSTGQVRGNFYKSLSGGATASNNLDLDEIVKGNYFTDFTGHQYTLKSSATLAIDHGYQTGISPDIKGLSVPQGSAEDIGAYEFMPENPEINPPSAPSMLTSTHITIKSITLKWKDNSDDESAFLITRMLATDASEGVSFSVKANDTIFTDPNLPPSTTFVYTVQAINDGGSSAESNRCIASTLSLSETRRIQDGLIAYYNFNYDPELMVRDLSAYDEPVDLVIRDPLAVSWEENGKLKIEDNTVITSKEPVRKISEAIKSSGAMSVECWLNPLPTSLNGTSRIISLGKDDSDLGFAIDQYFKEDNTSLNFGVRLHTSSTIEAGQPTLQSVAISCVSLRQIVFVRDSNGYEALFINGKRQAEGFRPGDFYDWREDYQLRIGNDNDLTLPYQGTLYSMAIYNKALNMSEVLRNYIAGRTDHTFEKDINYLISIYPNPSKGVATIEFVPDSSEVIKYSKTIFRISDSLGKVLIEEVVSDPANKQTRSVNLEGRQKGTYLIQIISGNQISSAKLILQ